MQFIYIAKELTLFVSVFDLIGTIKTIKSVFRDQKCQKIEKKQILNSEASRIRTRVAQGTH